MADLEDRALQDWVSQHGDQLSPHNWNRYIDDVLSFFSGSLEDLKIFRGFLNSQDPNIQFTMEADLNTRSVNYLDITISINDQGFIETDLFTKSNLKNQLLLPLQLSPTFHNKKHCVLLGSPPGQDSE